MNQEQITQQPTTQEQTTGNQSVNEERLKKFQEMGIPIPMKPMQPPPSSLRTNSPKFNIIEQIKSGAKKAEIDNFIQKSSPNQKFQEIPVSKPKYGGQKKQQPDQNIPQVKTFQSGEGAGSSQAKQIEQMLYGGTSSVTAPSTETAPGTQNVTLDENYLNNVPQRDIRSAFNQRMQAKGTVPAQQTTEQQVTQQTEMGSHVLSMTEEEFKKRVIGISKAVSKKVSADMIKKIILEYVKSGQDIIVESKSTKKAEIIGKNKVRIEGKIYKLTPIATTIK